MKSTVVLDKNFLQGARVSEVRQLYDSRHLVMPGALFFELLTTDVTARQRCFAKLPLVSNPVHLVDHIGVLLKVESVTGFPCGNPSIHKLKIEFQFNSSLSNETYELPKDAKLVLQEQRRDVEIDLERLVGLVESIPSLFPGLISSKSGGHSMPHREVEALISDASAIKEFYDALKPHQVGHKFPAVGQIPSAWAHIRWLQVKMLFAVDLHIRYGGKLRSMLSKNVRTKLEHDIHDAQILAMGVLEGAIATREKKLVRWFQLLEPTGTVIFGAL